MIQVKVCGVTRAEDANAAIEAGADAVGLNFVAGTPRALDLNQAKAVSAVCAGRVVRVGVLQDESLDRISETVEQVGLDVVQLHGSESPEFVAEIPFPVIKVLPADAELLARAEQYPKVDLLIDHPSGGGSGETWSFETVRELVGRGRRAWIAGGLDAGNVRAAMSRSALANPAGLIVTVVAAAPSLAWVRSSTSSASANSMPRQNEVNAARDISRCRPTSVSA